LFPGMLYAVPVEATIARRYYAPSRTRVETAPLFIA